MIEVLDGLFLGNRLTAGDLRQLHQARITHVVNCAQELPNYHEGLFTYLTLGLRDPDPNLHLHLDTALSFIDEARRNRGRVLVHCFAAVSRSPAVVLAYLCHQGWTLEEAAAWLGARVWTDPDQIFLEQIAHRRGASCDETTRQRLTRALQGRVFE